MVAVRRLRILFLAPGWPPAHPAGSEVMGQGICKALADAGHDVTVSISRRIFSDGEYDLDGVHVLPFDNKGQDIDRARSVDVVIGHLADAQRATALGARYRIPSVVIVHNWQTVPIAASLVCFNSEWLAADHGYIGRHMIVRPHVPVADYATTPGDLVTLINSNPSKGIYQVMELADRMPDVQFLIVEGTYGNPIRPTPRPNITWQPFMPPEQMRDRVYARTRILLMPSKYESWGRTGIEALASGIPVISHPTPGLRESLGKAGTYADRDDIDAWESAIRRLFTAQSWSAASKKALTRAREVEQITSTDLTALVDTIPTLVRRR
jgi:glycosyltransferase involved in cell wall biosynthesis